MAKIFKVFRAGKYPQGDVSEQDVRDIAAAYDTAFHEAPLTVNHNDNSPAYAIVDVVKCVGKELFVSFRDFIDEAYEMNKKFRKPSIEIARYNGKPYLRAVTMCNFPQVKGLDSLAFSEEKKNTIYFTEDLTINLLKGDAMFSEQIQKLAEKLSINISNYNVEGDLLTAAIGAIENLQTKLAESANQVSSLNLSLSKFTEAGLSQEKFTELQNHLSAANAEITMLNKDRVEMLAEFAVNVKDCIPAQVESIKNIANVNFAEAKKFVEAMPPKKANHNLPRVNGGNETKEYTYDEILANPKLAQKYSETELADLKKKSKIFS